MAIVVIGTVFVDVKGFPSGKYIPGGRNAGTVETVHGGVARNVAENLANLGLKPIFVTLLDESGTAADVEARLVSRGVDMRFSRRTPDGMGTWLAVFNSEGDVEAAISRRPDMLPVSDILAESGDEIFAGADCVLFEMDLEEETVERIFSLAEKYNTPVYTLVSNMSIALERRRFLPKTACFVCNLQEAGILFGESYESCTPETLRNRIIPQLKKEQIPCMVVTMGKDGSVWATAEGRGGFCPAERVEVRDTAGAGDAFFAGTAAALTRGQGLQEACRLGTRLAAEVVTSVENVIPPMEPDNPTE